MNDINDLAQLERLHKTADSKKFNVLAEIIMFVLALAAITTIAGYIFGNKTLSMWGVAFFFLLGLSLITFEFVKSIVKKAKSNDNSKYTIVVVSGVLFAIVMICLSIMSLVAYAIVTLMMGLWEFEPNS